MAIISQYFMALMHMVGSYGFFRIENEVSLHCSDSLYSFLASEHIANITHSHASNILHVVHDDGVCGHFCSLFYGLDEPISTVIFSTMYITHKFFHRRNSYQPLMNDSLRFFFVYTTSSDMSATYAQQNHEKNRVYS